MTARSRALPVASLLALVGLVGLRTMLLVASRGTEPLFAVAMLDLCGLFLAVLGFVVMPAALRGYGALVLAFAFGLPLAGVGAFLEYVVSPEVSLIGAFVGLNAFASGGISGSVWSRTEFFGFALLLCLGFTAGGIYGAASTTSWTDGVGLLAPFTLVGWIGAATLWRPSSPRPTTL
ncbi:MAG: hypothetical protein H6721_20060 [Sandaracinus sp.]|nr:hypothetical protein [Myxococcales bacterium]MCB9604392.1 hypothetical protein [Sandaracinus sp.]MCB9617182.1 hypothetical protein [Sandaracinus sp.]MCB9634424.1 hypothetical protein [Sandaracinus sp.]